MPDVKRLMAYDVMGLLKILGNGLDGGRGGGGWEAWGGNTILSILLCSKL